MAADPTIEQLAQLLDDRLNNHSDDYEKAKYEDAVIGYIDFAAGAWVIDVPGRPNYVYCTRQRNSPETPVEALNLEVASKGGNRVKLERVNGEFVVRKDVQGSNTFTQGGVNLTVGKHTHRLGFGNEDVVEGLRFEPLQPHIAIGGNSLFITVEAGTYRYNGNDVAFPKSNINLASYRTGTANFHNWAKVGIDPTTNTLVAAAGTGQSKTLPLTTAQLMPIAFASNDALVIRIAGVQLKNAQTAITDYRAFYDLRMYASGQNSGGITTPGSSTDNAIVRWDGTGGTAIQNSAATISDTGTLTTTLIDNTPIGTTTPAAGYFSALREKIGGFFAIFTHANSADRTYTLPNYDGTLATLAGTEALTNKTIDGDLNTVQDLPLTALKTNASNTWRILQRNATGVVSDAIGFSFENNVHDHTTLPNGGTLPASSITTGTLDPARVVTGSAPGVASFFTGDANLVVRQFGAYKYQPFTIVGSSTASFSISSIPQTFSRMVLTLLLRSDRAAQALDGVLIRPNNNTTAAGTYYNETVSFPSTGAAFLNNLAATATLVPNTVIQGATATAGYFTFLIVEIQNYASTSNYRHYKFHGYLQTADTAGNLFPFMGGGTYKDNTNAITSITIAPQNGTNFVAGSGYGLELY